MHLFLIPSGYAYAGGERSSKTSLTPNNRSTPTTSLPIFLKNFLTCDPAEYLLLLFFFLHETLVEFDRKKDDM